MENKSQHCYRILDYGINMKTEAPLITKTILYFFAFMTFCCSLMNTYSAQILLCGVISFCLDWSLPPNQYEVMVQSTEASKWCKLAGKYLVSTTTDELVLSDISTGGVIYCWPYRFLRKFGQVEVKYLNR